MALETHRWTRSDLDRLPDDDGNRYEIINGELLVSPTPRPAHEYLVLAFGTILDDYCVAAGIARAYHGRPALVTTDSHTEPDIVVRQAMVPPPEKWDDSPMPLLVVEVLSDSTRRYDLVKKRGFYLATGVPEYWIVDGDTRTVRVITPNGERVEAQSLSWRPDPAVQPLEIDLPSLFADSLGSLSS